MIEITSSSNTDIANTNTHKVSHSRFTISIFKSRQHFMALCLGLWKYKKLALQQLKEILHRTKSPPISTVYTYDILQPKTPQAYGLVIVRFLSQLADLSQGKSVSIALKQILTKGQFLSQIRHSLTHKYKISNQLIMMARNIIIEDLKTKYWDTIYQQMIDQNLYISDKVVQEYQRIYNTDCPQIRKQKQVTFEDLQKFGNYQFHVKIPRVIQKQLPIEQILSLFQKMSSYKKSIMFSQFLKYYSKDFDEKYYFTLIHRILQQKYIKEDSLLEKMVLTKLKKLRFNNWIHYNELILKVLPDKILKIIQQPFKRAEEEGFEFYQPK